MKLYDLISKPYGKKCLRDLIECVIGVLFYYPPVSERYKLLCIDKLHGFTHCQVQSHDKPDEK